MQAFIIVAGGRGVRSDLRFPNNLLKLIASPVLMYSIEAFMNIILIARL